MPFTLQLKVTYVSFLNYGRTEEQKNGADVTAEYVYNVYQGFGQP